MIGIIVDLAVVGIMSVVEFTTRLVKSVFSIYFKVIFGITVGLFIIGIDIAMLAVILIWKAICLIFNRRLPKISVSKHGFFYPKYS